MTPFHVSTPGAARTAEIYANALKVDLLILTMTAGLTLDAAQTAQLRRDVERHAALKRNNAGIKGISMRETDFFPAHAYPMVQSPTPPLSFTWTSLDLQPAADSRQF
jgi:hypothetical protein